MSRVSIPLICSSSPWKDLTPKEKADVSEAYLRAQLDGKMPSWYNCFSSVDLEKAHNRAHMLYKRGTKTYDRTAVHNDKKRLGELDEQTAQLIKTNSTKENTMSSTGANYATPTNVTEEHRAKTDDNGVLYTEQFRVLNGPCLGGPLHGTELSAELFTGTLNEDGETLVAVADPNAEHGASFYYAYQLGTVIQKEDAISFWVHESISVGEIQAYIVKLAASNPQGCTAPTKTKAAKAK